MQRAPFEGVAAGDDSLSTALHIHVHRNCIQCLLQRLRPKNEIRVRTALQRITPTGLVRTAQLCGSSVGMHSPEKSSTRKVQRTCTAL
jgi:hypothetical protein